MIQRQSILSPYDRQNILETLITDIAIDIANYIPIVGVRRDGSNCTPETIDVQYRKSDVLFISDFVWTHARLGEILFVLEITSGEES